MVEEAGREGVEGGVVQGGGEADRLCVCVCVCARARACWCVCVKASEGGKGL